LVDNGVGAVKIVKSGAGAWVLSNSANTFSGGLVVNGGNILLGNTNNSLGNSGGVSAITINSTGGIGGTGATTAAITVNSGGLLSPGPANGNRVGTMFVGGQLNLNAGSTINIDLLGPGLANDLVSMYGASSLTLNGGSATIGVNL